MGVGEAGEVGRSGWLNKLADHATKWMLWVALAAGVAAIGVFVGDSVWGGGCVDLGGYRSSGCDGVDSASVLTGAVVAFWPDATDDSEEPCPVGWTPFDEGKGRFLVGAGTPNAESEYRYWNLEGTTDDRVLTTYLMGEFGGEEKHVLTVAEMPPHEHHAKIWFPREDDVDGNYPIARQDHRDGTTGVRGGGEPHNNVPPFIALSFCKYEGRGSGL